MATPSVGRIVHYVPYASAAQPGATCRAAIITSVSPNPDDVVLTVFAPNGVSVNAASYEPAHADGPTGGGSWHWPERVD